MNLLEVLRGDFSVPLLCIYMVPKDWDILLFIMLSFIIQASTITTDDTIKILLKYSRFNLC